jgi:hypothetical protein
MVEGLRTYLHDMDWSEADGRYFRSEYRCGVDGEEEHKVLVKVASHICSEQYWANTSCKAAYGRYGRDIVGRG